VAQSWSGSGWPRSAASRSRTRRGYSGTSTCISASDEYECGVIYMMIHTYMYIDV
jgi:hypothetical protein